jgi:tripartite-type tricarboxylate transporter receptor subunit TctC
MRVDRFALVAIAVAYAALAMPVAQAQDFPNRPIRIVVPFAPGNSVDVAMRRVADAMSTILGQPVTIENKGGAGGVTGSDMVAKSPPDGYTLVEGLISTHAFSVSLYKALPYDPLKDFVPITRFVYGGFNSLMVHPSFPASNIRELIAVAKDREAQGKPLTYGSGGVGSPPHLLVELLKQATGIKATHIPYRGSALIPADVMNGTVDFFIASPTIAVTQHNGKTLKAIAVDSPERSRHLPDVPTMREFGVDNVEAKIWVGLFAPAGTPTPVVMKLHAAVLKALEVEAVKTGLDKDGMTVMTDPSPDAFRKAIAEDIVRWGAVIKAAGIQPE